MGYYTPDPYYQPEKFGLEIVATHDQPRCYDFDLFVVWKDINDDLYWAYDSGCSCPSPFENYTAVSDLEHGTKAELLKDYEEWCKSRYSLDANEHFNMLDRLSQL